MTARDFGPPTFTPREHLGGLVGSGHSVAFLFGSERFGMSNDDVYRCHAALSHPDRSALRLAQPGCGDPGHRLRMAHGIGRLCRSRRRPGAPCRDPGRCPGGGGHAGPLGACAGGHRLSRSGRAEEADAAAEPAVQPCAAHRGGNPHPAWCRQGHVASGCRGKKIDCGHHPDECRHVHPPAFRHPVHPRPRSCRAQQVGGDHLLSGPACAGAASPGALVLDARAALAGPLHLAVLALAHRHRDPPGRADRRPGVHRPRHGRRHRRDGRDRRGLHHLPGRDAGRHLADQGRQAPSHAGPQRGRRRRRQGAGRLHGRRRRRASAPTRW